MFTLVHRAKKFAQHGKAGHRRQTFKRRRINQRQPVVLPYCVEQPPLPPPLLPVVQPRQPYHPLKRLRKPKRNPHFQRRRKHVRVVPKQKSAGLCPPPTVALPPTAAQPLPVGRQKKQVRHTVAKRQVALAVVKPAWQVVVAKRARDAVLCVPPPLQPHQQHLQLSVQPNAMVYPPTNYQKLYHMPKKPVKQIGLTLPRYCHVAG